MSTAHGQIKHRIQRPKLINIDHILFRGPVLIRKFPCPHVSFVAALRITKLNSLIRAGLKLNKQELGMESRRSPKFMFFLLSKKSDAVCEPRPFDFAIVVALLSMFDKKLVFIDNAVSAKRMEASINKSCKVTFINATDM